MATLRIRIDPAVYESQLGQLNSQLNQLQSLADSYRAKKSEAQQAWGEQDANLQKACQICDDAVAIVNRKIEAVNNAIDGIRSMMQSGQAVADEVSAGLDEAAAAIAALK